jgi:hypothetical protein
MHPLAFFVIAALRPEKDQSLNLKKKQQHQQQRHVF